MPLDKNTINHIEDILKKTIRNKFSNYNPETNAMPFHFRLLGKDRMALFSFIQSMNTTFGISVFEQIAIAIANNNPKFQSASHQQKSGNIITSEAHKTIQTIMDSLSAGQVDPNKPEEMKRISKVCKNGEEHKVKLTKIDVLLKTIEDEIFMIDIKTAKPNKDGYKGYKRTLLEWVASTLYKNPNAKINTLIAIPYNPYAPNPYQQWTMRGMLDIEHELLVAEEFWDFLGDENTYIELLDCFEKVGNVLRPEIDEYFKKFR